jgi:hypothetical protein
LALLPPLLVLLPQISVYAWGPVSRLHVKAGMNRTLLYALALAAPLAAQTPCSDAERDNNRGDRGRFCEMREYTLANAGRLDVDANSNGGIRIVGSDRADVLVRAKVQANAPSLEEARTLAGSVRVLALSGNVRAEGPQNLDQRGWAVSFEVLVPRRTSLELKAHNGGINIADVEGDINFDAQNGGVNLQRLAGDVKGRTVNGGLKVELEGATWRGSQLDVATTNGGINVTVPSSYSARFETSTVNGNVSSDIPGVQISGERRERERQRNVSVTLGSGGPLVRLVTTNGGIRLNRS